MSPVLFVWLTNSDFLLKLEIQKSAPFTFIVTPVTDRKLFQIRIFTSQNVVELAQSYMGNRLDGIIVGQSVLPQLLRDFGISAWQILMASKLPPFYRRRQAIEEIIKNRIMEPFHHFIASSFVPKKEDK